MEVLPPLLLQVVLYIQAELEVILPTINLLELDHLMTSLDNFKMNGRNVDEPVSLLEKKSYE